MLPNGCLYSTNAVTTIQIDVLGLYYEDLLTRIVKTLGLTAVVNPAIWCRAALVIDLGQGKIWYQKKELSTLRPGTHSYKFAVMVAEGNGLEVSDEDIACHLTSSREDNVLRKAKAAFVKSVMEGVGISGKDASKKLSSKLLKRRSQAWALNCSVEFIS